MTIPMDEALEMAPAIPAHVYGHVVDEILDDLEYVRHTLRTIEKHRKLTMDDDPERVSIAGMQIGILRGASLCLAGVTTCLAPKEIVEESDTEETNDRCECCFCEEKDGQK